ncbi:voltage-gated chloride channel family protein [Persicobacter psychrovividus]|uniref:Voltage-gated chloride channel protein n=1 Tax=Persicobacter psychrovividus TaxID=387638 RepID=A0ABN6LC46_9BACT|nr:voltage-gated chloride channel protein [Persicobacter psychrovividus]
MYIDLIKHIGYQIKLLVKWFLLIVPIAVIVGSLNAFFLWLLEEATGYRMSTYAHHSWIIYLLPLAGILIVWSYKKYGKNSAGGNNLIIDEIHEPGGGVPTRMAPFVLFSTVITHLFGGSAGREGTAVQIGGAIAQQFGKWYKLDEKDTKLILISGVAAGFGSVFGTPITGAIFALEVLAIGKIKYHAVIPALIASVVGNFVTIAWGISHEHLRLVNIAKEVNVQFNEDLHYDHIALLIGKIALAGIAFGFAGFLFGELTHKVKEVLTKVLKNQYLVPVVGAIFVIAVVKISGTYDYIGIGTSSYLPGGVCISSAFHAGGAKAYSWLMKLVMTAVTLGSGFKGGEVTPLFFVGATLGNTLAGVLNAPVALFAALGFIGVFSAATNTPMACTIMGVELFGSQYLLYFAVVCFVAYYFSGHTGIYTSQRVSAPKLIGRIPKEQGTLGQLRKEKKAFPLSNK